MSKNSNSQHNAGNNKQQATELNIIQNVPIPTNIPLDVIANTATSIAAAAVTNLQKQQQQQQHPQQSNASQQEQLNALADKLKLPEGVNLPHGIKLDNLKIPDQFNIPEGLVPKTRIEKLRIVVLIITVLVWFPIWSLIEWTVRPILILFTEVYNNRKNPVALVIWIVLIFFGYTFLFLYFWIFSWVDLYYGVQKFIREKEYRNAYLELVWEKECEAEKKCVEIFDKINAFIGGEGSALDRHILHEEA